MPFMLDSLEFALGAWRRASADRTKLTDLAKACERAETNLKPTHELIRSARIAVAQLREHILKLADIHVTYSGKDAAAGEYEPPLTPAQLQEMHLLYITSRNQTITEKCEAVKESLKNTGAFGTSAFKIIEFKDALVKIEKEALVREQQLQEILQTIENNRALAKKEPSNAAKYLNLANKFFADTEAKLKEIQRTYAQMPLEGLQRELLAIENAIDSCMRSMRTLVSFLASLKSGPIEPAIPIIQRIAYNIEKDLQWKK